MCVCVCVCVREHRASLVAAEYQAAAARLDVRTSRYYAQEGAYGSVERPSGDAIRGTAGNGDFEPVSACQRARIRQYCMRRFQSRGGPHRRLCYIGRTAPMAPIGSAAVSHGHGSASSFLSTPSGRRSPSRQHVPTLASGSRGWSS